MKKELKCIGIGAQCRYGKTTLSEFLAPRLCRCDDKGNWGVSAFANSVKDIYCNTFGVTREFVEEWKTRDECPPGMNKTVREGLIFIGDGFRKICSNIWIDILFRDEDKSLYKVISDERYVNEAKAIRCNHGINVLIYRPDKVNYIDSLSESELRPYILYCAQTGREGWIADFPEVQERRIPSSFSAGDYWFGNDCNWTALFDNIKYFDLFIRNDGTVDEFYDKVSDFLIPLIRKRYQV